MASILERFRTYVDSRVDARVGAANQLGIGSPWADSSHLSIISELYGLADSSDIVVNRDLAQGIPVVAKGRRVLATNIGRMRLVNHKGSGLAPMQMPYLQQPERNRPLSATLTWTIDALYYYPRTWWIIQQRDAAGWPARGGVKLLDRADAEFDSDGTLVKAWGKPVDPRDVIQFDSPDGGLLHDGRKILRRAAVLARAASLAEENPVPGINLHNGGAKLEGDQITDLLNSWMSARRKYGVGYTDSTITATAMGIADSQLLIEGRKQMDADLARQIGLPAWAADIPIEGASLNYSNRASRAWELIDLYLATYMTPISSRLSMNDTTPIGWSTDFATDDLTREDTKTRFETYKLGIDAGFIDQAYIEAQEGQTLKGTPA